MRRNSLSAFAFLAALLTAGLSSVPAPAAVIAYLGQCTTECDEIGFGSAGAVLATITVNDAAIAPDAVLDKTDVIDFTLDFGDVDIDFASAVGFNLHAVLNAAGDGLIEFVFAATEALFLDPEAETIGMVMVPGFDFWQASETGSCLDFGCTLLGVASGTGAIGTRLGLVLLPDSAIPEPAALAVFGLGLVGLAAARRRRR